jgi:hypothetical protein
MIRSCGFVLLALPLGPGSSLEVSLDPAWQYRPCPSWAAQHFIVVGLRRWLFQSGNRAEAREQLSRRFSTSQPTVNSKPE